MPTTGTIAGENWVTTGAAKAQLAYEWTETYSEENSADGTRIAAVVQTAADPTTRLAFPVAMCGSHSTGAGNKIRRVPPEPHPVKNWLYCTRCDLQNGVGYYVEGSNKDVEFNSVSGGSGGTGKLRWNVEFSDLGYDVRNDKDIDGLSFGELSRYIIKRSTAASESLPLQGTTWKFTSDNKVIPEPTVKLFTTIQLEYTWMWVPTPLLETTWVARLNNVNNGAFDPNTSWANYAVETVLFTNYEKSDPVRDAAGNRCYHITFQLLVRPGGWNSFYRGDKAGGPGFDPVISNDANSKYPFTSSSLNGMFAGG